MARKSSFLQGFEVGSDLYNKGFSQAMSLAQMKKQEDEKKYQRGRDAKADVLAADAAAQRKKVTDLQLRQINNQIKAQEEKKARGDAGMAALGELVKSTTGSEDWHTLTDEGKVERFRENDKKYAIAIERGGVDVTNSYDVWSQKSFWETAIGKATKNAEKEKTTDNLNAINFRNGEKQKKRDTIARANKLLRLGLDPGDLSNAAEAEAKLMELDLAGIYDPHQVARPTHTGADVGDINNDGVVDARDILAAKGDVYAELKQRALDATTDKEVRDAARAMTKFQFEQGLRERTALRTEEAKKFKLGPTGASTATMDDFVFSGIPIGDIARSTDGAFAGVVLKERTKAIDKAKLKSTPTLERIRLSGASDRPISQGQQENLFKAFTVKKQIKTVEQFMERLDTGPIASKSLEIKRLFNTGTGKDVAKLEGLLNSIMPGLARGIYGEVGVLTEDDINNYKKTFVSLDNDRDVNRFLFDMTQKMVDNGIVDQLHIATKAGQNVSGFYSDVADLLGEQAPGGLGVPTTNIQTLPAPVQEQVDSMLKADPNIGLIGPGNMKNILSPQTQDYRDLEDAQTAVNLNSLATGSTGSIVVKVEGAEYRISPDTGEAMKQWVSGFDAVRAGDKSGGQPLSKMHWYNPDLKKLMPFILPQDTELPQASTPRLPDSPSGSVSDVQVDPSWPALPAHTLRSGAPNRFGEVESPQLQESPRSRFSAEQVEQIKSVLGQFRNKGEALAEVLGDETLRGKAMRELGKRFGDKIPSIDDLKELLPELEEAPTPEDNQFEEDAREATRWAPHASSEAVMDESQDKPAIPPLPRGNHDEWRAQLRTMAEKKGGTTNAAKATKPFVGLNVSSWAANRRRGFNGVITAQDDNGVWIGKPGPKQRFLPWSEVIKLIDKDQIQPGNSEPEEYEGPDAIDEVIKGLGNKKDALMKVLGDEELRKKALEELRKRFQK